jgi:hypothetical protein
MTYREPSFKTNQFIEEVTAQRIREFESKCGEPVRFPVPIEKIVEIVLGLDFSYEEVEEEPGEQILGGLDVERKSIIINTAHMDLFRKKPGLERSTIGHEAGHWDIDIDRCALEHPTFQGLDFGSSAVKRRSHHTGRAIEVLIRKAFDDDRVYRLYKKLIAGQDTPEARSAVDRYQSALLMPAWLVKEAGTHLDFTCWRDLYALAKDAQVTISNLTVRLQRLSHIYIPEGAKTIYRSVDEYAGQVKLF